MITEKEKEHLRLNQLVQEQLANSLGRLRGIHAGKLCIVAGAGPSLRHLTAEMVNGHILMAVNAAAMKFPDANYAYTCDPASTIRTHWQVMLKGKATTIVSRPNIHEGFGAYDRYREIHYLDGIECRCVHVLRDEYRPLKFRPDDNTLIFGISSVHSAAHLAHLMGCKPIVLVGCDCGIEQGKRYFYEFPGQEQYADEWIVETEGFKTCVPPIDTPILSSFIGYWDRLGAENPDAGLINCGNAIIPSIPKEDIHKVLKS